jgi:hypothetical protein
MQVKVVSGYYKPINTTWTDKDYSSNESTNSSLVSTLTGICVGTRDSYTGAPETGIQTSSGGTAAWKAF